MAVTVKENVNPEVMLEEPKDILERPPRLETPGDGENEAATIAKNLRDKLARDRVILENEERRTRGPWVGHNVFFYSEVQKKLVSRLFLSLGTEGKKTISTEKSTRRNLQNVVPDYRVCRGLVSKSKMRDL